MTSLKIKLGTSDKQPRTYTLRLHFAEPDDVNPTERLFNISVQGKQALASLDVVKEAGGRNRALVKELRGVSVGDELVIDLSPTSSKLRAAILCGLEIQAEGW
ncbi:MAG: hypothetical protein FJ302_21000 [Planctomycetes bacterium]|nr:hypothetical protein [Planctomycetota bacterium]